MPDKADLFGLSQMGEVRAVSRNGIDRQRVGSLSEKRHGTPGPHEECPQEPNVKFDIPVMIFSRVEVRLIFLNESTIFVSDLT